MKKEQVMAILKENRDRLDDFHVTAIYLFGSVLRGEEKKTSDIDLLVEFDPDARIGLFQFSRLQRMLSELLGCKVDLVTPEALHKTMRGQVLKEAVRAA
jgi:uncharacterized protein